MTSLTDWFVATFDPGMRIMIEFGIAAWNSAFLVWLCIKEQENYDMTPNEFKAWFDGFADAAALSAT